MPAILADFVSSISLTTWQQSEASLSAIRRQVFIVEQHVPEALEWDEYDTSAIHALAFTDQQAIGCARLLPQEGKIGRMAVLPEWRKHGVGSALLQILLEEARKQGQGEVGLSAQIHAIPFYEKAGFAVYGPVYDDAGIPHRDMIFKLTA